MPPEPTAVVVQFHRAFGGPTVTVGPFDDVEAATAWQVERDLRGMIVGCISPDEDTSPGAPIWC